MADNIVGGLFGIDPQQLIQQRQETDARNAFRYAQLEPLEQAKMSIYQGGAGLTRGLSGLLGGDPQLEKVSQIKQLSSQFDLSSPTGMRDFARALQQFAPNESMMAAKRADEMEVSAATVTQKTREKSIPTSGLGKLLFEKEELLKAGTPANDPRIIAYDKAIAAEGEGKGSKTTIDLGGLAGLFAKEEAKASAKDVTEQIGKAQDQLKTNSKLSRDIAELEKIIPNTFTGQLSDIAKTSSKTLAALGVPVSEKASNTEVANALFNNFVLPAVKQLPGSLAAKELAFLQQTKPNALQEPATINRLVKMLKEDISANRALVKRADTYQKQDKFGSLQGFNIALQSDEIYTNLNKYNALKAKVQAKQPITKDEAEFAKSVEKELGI
jgi:hypothetical protein